MAAHKGRWRLLVYMLVVAAYGMGIFVAAHALAACDQFRPVADAFFGR